MSPQIKFYRNSKYIKDKILIGKTGQLRFKPSVVEKFSIKKGQRWMLGIDENENPTQHLYVLFNNENDFDGYKVSEGNGNLYINAKTIVEELNIHGPLYCDYEPFHDKDYSGIVVKIGD
jgi:hypothetical protein